ncbi:unnamed protein product [Cyclocybe aegerita]|uniref:Bacterial surface antigen (D15) domain-containing protein n=1 Tax=Cyclocybe aegerita TaxID=1973307 RepID=A0A8S0WXY5_CYCAE|nr:unnamed protein product [Cyclocybe aegerita]
MFDDGSDRVSAPSLRPPLHNTSSPRDKEPVGFEKLLKWQDERRARKLKGEYESAVTHLSEVINGNLDAPLRISAVRVEGATGTRASFLSSLIDPALSSSSSPPTLKSVLHTTRSLSSTLQSTGLFSSLTCTLVPPTSPTSSLSPSSPSPIPEVDLLIKARERGKYFLSSSTEIGNAEGTASAVARVRNVFGGAETFEANVSMGTKTRRAFRATLSAPVVLGGRLGTVGEVGVYGMERDLTSYASCMEGLRGARASLKHTTPHGTHELAYDFVSRHIANLAPSASLSMRHAAGPSLKSAVSHTFVHDTRDDRLAGTRGFFLKTTSELAGRGGWLGGDAQHVKLEVEGQVSRRVASLAGVGTSHGGDGAEGGQSWWKSLALSLSWRSGVLWSLRGEEGGNGKEKTLFSDRFQLGGPTSVRGFVANGMGPRDGDDSLGGTVYYAAGASVTGNIPGKPHWPVKTHLWANAGRLDVLDQSNQPSTQPPTLTRLAQPALSAGLGLVYRLDPVRVEVNFGMPLALSEGERGRRGVQVGVGVEFV